MDSTACRTSACGCLDMNLKHRRLLIWIVVLAGGGILTWHYLLTQRSTIQATSPDSRYMVTVRSSFPLSGGYHYNIVVRRSDGETIRQLSIDDQLVGWGRDPAITWTADSRTVTIGLQDGDTDGGAPVAKKRMSIDVQ